MPRRSSRSQSIDEDEETKRNPRRRSSQKRAASGSNSGNEKDDHHDKDEDTEPMDVDDDESADPASIDGDDSDEGIRNMVRRRKDRQRQASSTSNPSSKKSSNSKESSSKNNRRSSTRATRFTGGMKEPPSDSVRDLFQGSNTNTRVTKQRNDSSSDEEKQEEAAYKSTTRRRNAKKSEPKSPARRHSRARKSVKTEDTSDEESSEEEVEEEDDDEGDMKIQRILASRSETKAKWREISQKMNSSEVTDGSRWFQDQSGNDDVIQERFLVKWSGLSYLHCSWETHGDLIEQVDGAKTYMTTFFRKSVNGVLFDQDERKDGDYYDPGFVQIDRLLDIFYEGKTPRNQEEEDASKPSDFDIVLDKNDAKFEEGTGRQFLVKWSCMNYSNCSYEFERDLMLADIDITDSMRDYYERTQKPNKVQLKQNAKQAEEAVRRAYKVFGDNISVEEEKLQKDVEVYKKQLADHVFLNGGQLRDYQAEGVTWFLSNYVNGRSCILADEMGLGKTLQTAAFVNLVVQKMHRPGPFLIAVPLSTIAHWQREFVGWTGLNTIVYHGSAEDRKWIREFEFPFAQDRPASVGANALYLNKCGDRKAGVSWMTTVVVTTPEMLVADDAAELAAVNWEVLVVDEAHRLKNKDSKLAQTLRKDQFSFKHKILLSGTPIQNDIKEFWTLLNFIDPKGFNNEDDFLDEFGDIKSKEKIDELHETIRPYILRRLKEDVEKSVPPKEETLIEVEMTVLQKQYYRALYEKNVGFLHKNKKKALDGPSLSNLAMQLRKCCNHVFLLNGVEEEIRNQQKREIGEAEFLTTGSGKFVLLDKLLPRLKQDGHRVLIFSQFKIMLDVLEDYLYARKMKFERIDGSITGHKRQQAIDRYQDPTSKEPPFVMLLSTRAGGVGINLTAADTCIIFDSDWNPQNDLQAQARCHRIGQTKKVKVYRLLTRKTYEMQMFHMSSLKMGLDQAVLKGFEAGSSGEGAMTKEEVERLLRHGAYDIFNEEKTGTAEAESNNFIEQDIDSILERRSRKVVHENTGSKSTAKGGTFSKASFSAPKNPNDKKNQPREDVDIEDPEFWKKMVGEALPEVESELKPRRRNKTNYSERLYERQLHSSLALEPDASDSSDSDSDASASSDDEEETDIQERSRWGGQKPNHWKRIQAEAVMKALERYGYGVLPWDHFKNKLPQICDKFSIAEIHRLSWSLVLLALCEGARDDAEFARKRAERQAEKKREENDGDILAESKPTETQFEMTESSFKKLWKSNVKWAHLSLADAVAYAGTNEPRSGKIIEQNDQVDEITILYYGSLWPALKGRGWKEEATETGSSFTYDKYRFDSPSGVLNEVLRIHPELANMVIPILNTLEQSRLQESKKEEEDRSKHLGINSVNVDLKVLNGFLLRYSPFQLISDRKASKRLAIGRRVLTSCYYVHATNTLVIQASSDSALAKQAGSDSALAKQAGSDSALAKQAGSDSIDQFSQLLVVDRRSALPHPLWNLKHDTTLIRAIAKHGWVDREKACRAIMEDSDIKWGFPFELEEESKATELGEGEFANLRNTASRAAMFLRSHPELIETLKGCNRHLIIESYGLKHHVGDGEEADAAEWKVDDETLQKASTMDQDDSGVREPLDLPVKKDIAKRAKTVLQKSLAALESGMRPAVAKGTTPVKTGEQAAGSDHGYAVLDQGNRCCILLAEMVRGVVKGSHTKMAKQVRMLCSLAHEEALALSMMFTVSDAKDDKAKGEEMQRMADQIVLAKKSLKTSAVPGKNILRVMLGLEPVVSRNQSEPLFPSESAIQVDVEKAKQNGKKEPARRDDGALGDRSIVRALKKAFDKNDGSPCMFNANDDPETGLQLTMIETLILFTFCSEGIPSSPDTSSVGTGSPHTWDDIGSVLEIAAKDYYQLSKEKLTKSRAVLKKLEGQVESDSKAKAAKKLVIDEYDEAIKSEAAKQAVDFAADSQKLAKKSIMLLEKVRRFAFSNSIMNSKNPHKFENGLGPKVPAWLGKELTKLAETHDVVDGNGKPMCYTTTDLLHQNPAFSNTPVAALLDKKSCRQVVSQIALLGRLRSIFSKNLEEDLQLKVTQAMKNSKKVEDNWDKRPQWWDGSSSNHTMLLLKRLNEHGFINVLSDGSGFGPSESAGNTGKTLRELGLTKSVIQQRANQLIRELHAVEESEEMMRLLQERRNRAAAKKQGFDRSLAECHTNTSTSSAKSSAKRGGIQTGLHAFFLATKSVSKKQKVIDVDGDEEESSSPTSASTGKRKESPAGLNQDSPQEKKAKKIASVFQVVPGPSAAGTPEKKLRTVVTADGVIELVSVPK